MCSSSALLLASCAQRAASAFCAAYCVQLGILPGCATPLRPEMRLYAAAMPRDGDGALLSGELESKFVLVAPALGSAVYSSAQWCVTVVVLAANGCAMHQNGTPAVSAQ